MSSIAIPPVPAEKIQSLIEAGVAPIRRDLTNLGQSQSALNQQISALLQGAAQDAYTTRQVAQRTLIKQQAFERKFWVAVTIVGGLALFAAYRLGRT